MSTIDTGAATHIRSTPEKPPAAKVRFPSDEPRDRGHDSVEILRGLAILSRTCGLYPTDHPVIRRRLADVDRTLQGLLRDSDSVQIDLLEHDIHVDGRVEERDGGTMGTFVDELDGLGVHSLKIESGVEPHELLETARFLAEPDGIELAEASANDELRARGVAHVTLGRVVPIDSSWEFRSWPRAPTDVPDAGYAESLERAREAFESFRDDTTPPTDRVRDLVRLLVHEVAGSGAALAMAMSIKQYENQTYCHSVNVTLLALVLARRLGLATDGMAHVAEAALLHDIGKTRIPREVLCKPGPLDRAERRLVQQHPRKGAEILLATPGLGPLTPTVALEHHTHFTGGGYPELFGEQPHWLSQLIAVVDVYESLTGARPYRDPASPEQACLMLFGMAGEHLNPDLVKAFISSVTWFPPGTVVRTDREEIGVVVEAVENDPLHPVIRVVVPGSPEVAVGARVDTSRRDNGGYLRNITETLSPRHIAVDPIRIVEVDGHSRQ